MTQVRVKKFLETVNLESVSFNKMHEESLVVSTASKNVTIGNGNLRSGGFSCIVTIFTGFFGELLQVFKHVLGLKRTKVNDIAKTHQCGEKLVSIVGNEVYRLLHFMRAHELMNDPVSKELVKDVLKDSARLSSHVTKSFKMWLDKKMENTNDEALCFLINFVASWMNYATLQHGVRIGDYIVVENIYQWFLPT